jgi:two-component system chemotaxis sensor kinase CheA
VIEPDPDFLEIFRDEARGRLDRIVNTLLALEAGHADADAVDSLFRDTHTIKGAAGMIGLDEVCALAHAMEDGLSGARDGGAVPSELVAPLLSAADGLRRHIDGAGESVADLILALTAHATGVAATIAPSPVPAIMPSAVPAIVPSPAPRVVVERAPAEPVIGSRENGEPRSIRVPAEKIDTLLDLVGETVLHRRRLEHALGGERAVRARRPVSDELDLGERLLDDLKNAAIGLRTLPLSSIMAPLPRVVRDLASATGKEVELVVEGVETELDRSILEGLPELLVHLLRNAIGHGIETPEERVRLGKSSCGRLELRTEQRGGLVEITVGDDGRGVSAEALAEGRRTGSLADVLALAGFSTAKEVSDISGRGVGLDAVKTRVESYGGEVEARSTPGRGTQVILRLPLALALMEVMLVERGGNIYGLPLGSVEEVVSLGARHSLGSRQAIELRGRSIPLADLSDLMGGSAGPPPDRAPVVVLMVQGRRMAAICDDLLGNEEVVVKRLGPWLSPSSGYLGAAILGSGRIALLADPAVLVAGQSRRRPTPGARALEAPVAEPTIPKVLVVEDSLTIRELQRGILEAAGYRVQTARDGRDALKHLDHDKEIGLVLTDVEMPEMDGIELTHAIRADPTSFALPVVILTSLGEEDVRRRGIDAGADAYIVKRSFDQRDLLKTVERLVDR